MPIERGEAGMQVRNVRIQGRRTSIRLEPTLWEAVEEICHREQVDLAGLCERVSAGARGGNFTSALRCWVVDYYRRRPARAAE
ncbi:ribbon-helix-helix domain-containing protein [Oleomonas cavernae]|nr:ribbon-helix-helix domain-containing protein [Oleomonas cavernae]